MALSGGKMALARLVHGLSEGSELLQRLAEDEDVLQLAKQAR